MIDSFIRSIITLFLFLFPIFYLPFTSESYDYNKMVLVVVTCLVLLILFSLKIAREKKICLVKNTFGLPLFIIAVIALASTFFVSPNPIVAITTPLATTSYVSSFILYILFVYVLALDFISLSQISTIFVFDALILSVYTIFSFLGIFPNASFTPAGNLVSTAMFLAVIAAYLLSNLLITIKKNYFAGDESSDKTLEESEVRKRQDPQLLILQALSFLLISGTAIFLSYQILYVQKPVILPFAYGWTIALEILKNLKTLLLGIGPSNFITAFIIGKPLVLNTTPFWNVVFTSSSSFFLNLITETGLVSGIAYLFILFKSLKLIKSPTTHNSRNSGISRLDRGSSTPSGHDAVNAHSSQTASGQPTIITLLFSLILQIFLPSSVAVFTLTIILLAASSKKEQISLTPFARGPLAILKYFPLLVSLLFAGLIIYFGGKVYLAEVYFKQSLDNILNNKPSETYNLQKKALALVPNMDRYHLVFSQTNLALAQGIASKKELTDEDKQYLPRLVYQAIDHARTSVTLYRTNIFNWDNLAKTYSAIINYATGADEWAIVSYRQKIALDPLSPSNHLALGNLYKLLNKFELASEEFKSAIKLKSDLANAHYQLALMYKTQNKYKDAYNEYKTTLLLLKENTSEAETVKKEMAEIEYFLPPQDSLPSTSTNPTSTDQTIDLQPNLNTIQNLQSPQDTISLPQPPIIP